MANQFRRFARFGNVPLNAESSRALMILDLIEGGEKNNRNAAGGRILFDALASLPPVNLRHADIEKNNIRLFFLYLSEAFQTIQRGHNLKSGKLEVFGEHIENRRLIIHQ